MTTSRRRWAPRATATVAALVVAVAACTSEGRDATVVGPVTGEPAGGTGTSDVPPVVWVPCEGEEDLPPEAECATVTVPLDHAEPDGRTIDLALARVAATGEREGAVILNPGGPGGSGIDFLSSVAAFAPAYGDLAERFDLVGVDPRGVDRSGGLRCQDDDATERLLVQLDPTPDTPEEGAALDAAREEAVEACRTTYGDDLRHYSTEQTARDMDVIRAALGDEQLTYYGISYGTYLGAVYATLFPERVRAMVLDSAYDPTGQDSLEQARIQLEGFESEFDAWAAWCEEDETCAFRAPDVGARWDALVTLLDAAPSPSAEDPARAATEAVLRTATAAALYDRLTWADLGRALADAEAGDGAGLLALADAYNGRAEDGSYSTLRDANSVIDCASGFESIPEGDPEQMAADLRQLAPRFAADVRAEDVVASCPDLLGTTVTAPRPLTYAGEGPIVVIGGTGDPATPFAWAEKMAGALGPAATLVTYDGSGHGASTGNLCLMALVGTLLADLQPPAAGTTCTEDVTAAAPTWLDELPVVVEAEPIELPAVVWQQFGFDSTAEYVDAARTGASPADVVETYREALVGWTASDIPGLGPGVEGLVFDRADRRLLVLAIPGDLLGEGAGVPDGGSLVLRAAS